MNIYPGSLPFALPLIATVLLTGGIAIYAFRSPKQAGAKYLGWMTASITVWSIFYILELLAPTISGKLLAGKLEYIGVTSTPVFWLLFSLEFTGHKDWLTQDRRLALFVIPALTLGLTFTNELHSLIWTKMSLDSQGYPPLEILGYGQWFWINVAYSYILILTGVVLYLQAYFQIQRPFRQQTNVMILASTIPLTVNAIRLFTPISLHGFDLTPFAFAFTGVFLAIGLFRFSLINLVPIAASLVMENLQDAVIVIDNSNRILAINPTARHWLDVGQEAIGQSIQNVLGPTEIVNQYWDAMEAQVQLEIGTGERRRWLDTRISPLRNLQGKILGRVVVARDNTREQTLLMSEKRRTRQIELLNQITNTALQTPDLSEALQVLADQMGLLLEADGAFITLWDDVEQRVTCTTAYGEFRDTYKDLQLKPDENTITASVLREGRPIPFEDISNIPDMNPNLAADVPTRSLLGLPLIANARKMGAVLISFNQCHRFTAEEIAIGEQAAGQIALTVYKAQLYEAERLRARQMGLVQEVSRQMAESLDASKICQKTVNAIVETFGYSEAAISLLNEANKLELIAISGTEEMGFFPGYQQDIGKGIIGHVADTHKLYFTKDLPHDPYYFHPSIRGPGAVMAAPLLLEEALIGVLYIQSAPPLAITPDDTQILETIASHLVTAIQKARFYADINEHLISITALQKLTQTINSSLELDNIFKTVVRLLKESYGYGYVSIYILEDSILRLGAQAGYPEEQILHEIPITSGITGRTLRTRQTQFVPNVKADPHFLLASNEVESEICVPLVKDKQVLGVLNIESSSSRPLTEKDVNLLIAFANPVALAIDNARLHAEITSLALTDGMTGLVNRRAFDQTFELEMNRAERYENALALIMIDIDSFKVYNDTYGHPAGDQRIKAIGRLLLNNVRKPDIAARYGGEEFVLLLPHTNKEMAMVLAERLRESAKAQAPANIPDGVPIPGYTLSLGVACFPEDGVTPAELLIAADLAELKAKQLGKNRVCVAGISKVADS